MGTSVWPFPVTGGSLPAKSLVLFHDLGTPGQVWFEVEQMSAWGDG
jgi:hypothetical protein